MLQRKAIAKHQTKRSTSGDVSLRTLALIVLGLQVSEKHRGAIIAWQGHSFRSPHVGSRSPHGMVAGERAALQRRCSTRECDVWRRAGG